MTNWQFDKDMLALLKGMKGRLFVSLEKDGSVEGQSYCALRITLEDKAIVLKNEEEEIPMLEDERVKYEEAARFSCIAAELSEPFKPYLVDVGVKKYPINERITGIQIVTDKIFSSQADMNIAIDMAVVIKTEKHAYIFSKSAVWFDEVIYINKDKDFNDICPIQSVIEMWNNDGELEIHIERTLREL